MAMEMWVSSLCSSGRYGSFALVLADLSAKVRCDFNHVGPSDIALRCLAKLSKPALAIPGSTLKSLGGAGHAPAIAAQRRRTGNFAVLPSARLCQRRGVRDPIGARGTHGGDLLGTLGECDKGRDN